MAFATGHIQSARSALGRGAGFEAFEPRLVLSAQSPADFFLSELHRPDELDELSATFDLGDLHATTGVAYAQETYGLTGLGQTVAIIDSGIAYDHLALGGGYGSSHRVVGGWDFAENDANPYDDGPGGFHGTHVAGIIGSDHEQNTGVASGVDLVALRVFDDAGAGYFEWVEQALAWVHDHRNDFENPITTVNISLGTDWNATSLPGWASLEDELAQLEADGIFIATAAGNGFANYEQPGLSYPAASEHVVAVGSIGADGHVSDFSQRHQRALFAPGEQILSTVPDYVFGSDGVANDWSRSSGTSMSAPYVAGASTLVREAMQLAGHENINQQTIYDALRAHADETFDPITQAAYSTIDVQATIDAILGDNDTAPIDTAPIDTAPIDTGPVPDSGAPRPGDGHQGSQPGLDESPTTTVTDLGTVDWLTLRDQALSGDDAWYAITAQRTGLMTVQTWVDTAGGLLQMELQRSDGSPLVSGQHRIDISVLAGEQLLLRVSGSSPSFDLRIVNVVEIDGTHTFLHGTAESDLVTVASGATSAVSLNGLRYEFTTSELTIRGGGGEDRLELTGTSGNDRVTINSGFVELISSQPSGAEQDAFVVADQFASVWVSGGGGNDQVTLVDSQADDSFTLDVGTASLVGGGYSAVAEGFGYVMANAVAGGFDTAVLRDSVGNDSFFAAPQYSYMAGDGFYHLVAGFDNVTAIASAGGYDQATMMDSIGDEVFRAAESRSEMTGVGFQNVASGFDIVLAFAGNGGHDRAIFQDTAGDDYYTATPDYALMYGSGYYFYAHGFAETNAISTRGGVDRAFFFDSPGDDEFHWAPESSSMSGDGFRNQADGFDYVRGIAEAGGNDRAQFDLSDGDHGLTRQDGLASVAGSDTRADADGFDYVTAIATDDESIAADLESVDYLFQRRGS